VDFLLALIELFSLGVTAEALRAIIGWKSAILLQCGSVDPKFQVEGVAPPHQPFFFSENYYKCSFVWYTNLDRSFFRFVRDHACDGRTDRRTDGRTEFSSLYRVCITCSAVKSARRGHPVYLKCSKTVWRSGLCPRTRWGSLQRSPRPPSWLGWGWLPPPQEPYPRSRPYGLASRLFGPRTSAVRASFPSVNKS